MKTESDYRELLEQAAYTIIAAVDDARQAATKLHELTGTHPLTRDTREALINLNVALTLDVFSDTPEDDEAENDPMREEHGQNRDGDKDANF